MKGNGKNMKENRIWKGKQMKIKRNIGKYIENKRVTVKEYLVKLLEEPKDNLETKISTNHPVIQFIKQ